MSNALSKEVSRRRSRGQVAQSSDVAIVGAGLGGLVSGAFLARAGLRVQVFDSHYVAGGCATQFSRTGLDAEGGTGHYAFDVGLHYVGDCVDGMIPRILRGLGIEQRFLPMDPDGFDTLLFPGLRFRIPVGIDNYRERLVEAFPAERRGIDRYVRLLHDVDRLGRLQERGTGGVAFGLAALRSLTAVRSRNATLAEFLDGCTRDPMLRAVIGGQNGDYGLPPSEVSALLHAGLAVHYFRGAYYPEGGGQVLADRLADVIEAAGGQVHLRCGVDRIQVDGGRVTGLATEPRRGEQHTVRAPAVISNADIQRTFLELLGPDALPRPAVDAARRWLMGGAIFMTFLGVKGALSDLGFRNTNYWDFDEIDAERMYQRGRGVMEGAPPIGGAYITSATVKDPGSAGHAPPGTSTLELMGLVPGDAAAWGLTDESALRWGYKRSDDYRARKAQVEGSLLDRAEALFPGLRSRILFKESATPATHTRFTRASMGTGYGLAATPQQFMDNRPGYRGPVKGLYLAGASTRSGHGIVGAMMSGLQAARRVAVDFGLKSPEV